MPSLRRVVSYPDGDFADKVDDVLSDYAKPGSRDHTGASAFWQSAILAAWNAKVANGGTRASPEQLTKELIKLQVAKEREEIALKQHAIQRREQRLEEFERDADRRRAAGAAEAKFQSADELVQHFKDTLPRARVGQEFVLDRTEAAPRLEYLAETYGFPLRDVKAAFGRLATPPAQTRVAPPPVESSAPRFGAGMDEPPPAPSEDRDEYDVLRATPVKKERAPK